MTYHATSPTSLFAPQNPLVSTASSSTNDQPYTNNSSISSQQYSTPVVSTKFSKLSSYLGVTNSITPSSHQFTTPPPVSMKMTLQASQTVSNTQKTMSDQHRYRSSDDIYSISVLLFISGICAIILLAFFIKVLVSKRRIFNIYLQFLMKIKALKLASFCSRSKCWQSPVKIMVFKLTC